MTKITISTKEYLTPVVRKGLMQNKQALAQICPYILGDTLQGVFNILYLENKVVVLEHSVSGDRYKVSCSSNGKYDLSPSYTKGAGRCKFSDFGSDWLVSNYKGVVLVDISDIDDIVCDFRDSATLNLSDKGIYLYE